MATKNIIRRNRIMALCSCAAVLAPFAVSTSAFADDAQPAASSGVRDIVVTAQKRSQRMQDVPISMTALDSKALEVNRVDNAIDLGSVVPNLSARATAGGAQTPSFTMRGVTSYGVVPGSDKEISIYIDGVYIGSTVGTAIDLPDVAQIEVLRGPQGTLFGRNSTAGAISVTTRDPSKNFGIAQDFTVGNYDEFRSKTRVDTGQFGNVSASFTYLHDERRGDIQNLGAGTTWMYPSTAGVPRTQVSPAYLGDKNLNAFTAAIKYEPSSDFKVVNKFDWTGNHYTPAGAAPVATYPAALGPFGNFLAIMLADQNPGVIKYDTSGTRPDAVNNSFTLPSYVSDWGDSLTATYHVNSHLSFKNILAYRETYLRTSQQLDGMGGMVVTPQAAADLQTAGFAGPSINSIIGSPFVMYGLEQIDTAQQWSDEFQTNYNSKLLTLTAGFMYFNLNTVNGGTPGMPFSLPFTIVPFGNTAYVTDPVLGQLNSTALNSEVSLAAYAQAEVHLTDKIDVVAGFRETNDKKRATWEGGPVSLGRAGNIIADPYNKSLPAYTVGVNYKPARDILVYAKYSDAFVSGGTAGTVSYLPEVAKSWEAGIKSDWFNHRVRANLSIYTVNYYNLQAASAGINVGHPELGLVVADQGNTRARGFEFESTFVPMEGVTLGADAGYTDLVDTYDNPASGQNALGVPVNLHNFFPSLQPKWTANLNAEYDTKPVFGESTMMFRIDAAWRDKELTDNFLVFQQIPGNPFAAVKYSPATWLINGRVSLDHIKLPLGEGQIAVWVKNMINAKEATFPDIFGFIGTTEFQPARTFGLDVNFKM